MKTKETIIKITNKKEWNDMLSLKDLVSIDGMQFIYAEEMYENVYGDDEEMNGTLLMEWKEGRNQSGTLTYEKGEYVVETYA